MATPYTTKEDVRGLLSRDTPTQPGTAASLPDATVDTAILAASSKIDSRLGAVYTVPFAASPDTPELVVQIAKALAAYDLDLTFREVRDYSSELNPVYLRYKEATDLLTQLQKGLAVLPDYTPPDPDPGVPDNPNDWGSVVDVINPCLTWPDSRWSSRNRMSYDDWNHW